MKYSERTKKAMMLPVVNIIEDIIGSFGYVCLFGHILSDIASIKIIGLKN